MVAVNGLVEFTAKTVQYAIQSQETKTQQKTATYGSKWCMNNNNSTRDNRQINNRSLNRSYKS